MSKPGSEKFPWKFNEDFDIVAELGRGGMGTVYKAIQLSLNREVALKVLEPTGPESEESRKRFDSEAQSMKKLDHQNIVQVFDYGHEGPNSFIAMTYVQGTTLSEMLRRRKRLDLDETILIVRQVARGLLYAHKRGIIHRDIKPSNILISPDNNVRITDFGISHAQGSERLTSTGTAMGTPEYMSPEQCQGDNVTAQSDLYSLGIIFYEMLCGEPPFTGSKPLDIAYKQVHNQPEPPTNLRADIPAEIERIIVRCLQKNRADRFPGATEFLEEIDRVLDAKQAAKSHKAPTRKLPSMIGRKSPQDFLMPMAFGLIAILTILQVALVLLQRKENNGVGLLTEFELSAPSEQRALETDSPHGYPLQNLVDGDLKTAWLISAADLSKNPVLVIRFPHPTLVTSIGFAVGYQKVKDDPLQDRFAMFQKPQDLNVRTVEGNMQKLSLENIHGVQYPPIRPVETTELRLEFKGNVPATSPDADLAISELRLVGLSFPDK